MGYTGCEAAVVILLKINPWDSLSNISRARNQLVIVTEDQCKKRDKLEELVKEKKVKKLELEELEELVRKKVKKMSIDTTSQEERKRTKGENSSLGKRKGEGKASDSSSKKKS